MPERVPGESPKLSRRGCLKLGGLTVGALLAAAGGACYARVVAPRRLESVTRQVRRPGLAAGLDGLRLAHLSDLHASHIVDREWIRAAVDRANALEPDLACLTGDFVYGSAQWAEACAQELSRLKAPGGAFAVLGNHDIWNGAEQVVEALRRSGIHVLRNQAIRLEVRGAGLWILGVDDPGLSCLGGAGGWEAMRAAWEPAARFVRDALAAAAPGEACLLLVHNPDFMEMLADDPVDLALAGHTHGGQVALPLVGPPLLPSCFGSRYAADLVASAGGPVYVSRGVGLIEPAVRWNCPPEVALLTLRTVPAEAGSTGVAPREGFGGRVRL